MIEADKKEYQRLALQAAAEGAVLLKNEECILPLEKEEKVAVFGRSQIEYYRSGTGSGGAVKVEYSTNLLEGLLKYGTRPDEELAQTYREWLAENPFDNGGGGWAAEPWYQKDMPLDEAFVQEVAKRVKKAIYVIGRTAGEDKDNQPEAGSFLLTKQEKTNLQKITEAFEDVIVVLNVSNIIDMSFLEADRNGHIKAVLYAWQGGMEGGNGAAALLTGKINPSGKLTDTIAKEYKLYPSSENYGDADRNFYQEDIYVGYRYFETFAPQDILYEFGYGLSYTNFSIQVENTEIIEQEKEMKVVLDILVKNTGDTYSGKEVVQVYFSAPQGKLGRPAKELAAYAKTKELLPGEETKMQLSFPVSVMAAYDDSGVTGHKSCYVMEPGAYRFFVGNSVRKAEETVPTDGEYCLTETKVIKTLEEAMAPVQNFERMKPGTEKADGTYEIAYEKVPTRTVDLGKRIEERLPEEIEMTGDRHYRLEQVAKGEITMESFIAQFSKEDLAAIVRGEGMGHPDVTPGTASAFGSVSDRLEAYGLPLACAADGPSGIRMESGNYARQLPIGTLLAATWNTELVKELYTMTGKEMKENWIDTLLGPGMNLHRDPLNGRNFEYYSEDPLVTGTMAAAAGSGIRTGGGHATIKHFACNNQEKRRSFVDAVVSERALRELYLKGYEIAVRSGAVHSIMTSYNPINGHYAASNYDLNTTILRKEWGYTGIVMTDWWAKMNDVEEGGEGVKNKTRDMVRAQNDLYMVVNNYGAEINANGDDTLQALEEGRLTVGELQRNAKNICRFLIETESFNRIGEDKKTVPLIHALPPHKKPEEGTVIYEIDKDPVVKVGMGEEVYIKVASEGTYAFIVNIMSEDSNMFQTAGEILINQEAAALIQTQGTAGRWIVQKLQKNKMEEGIYCVSPRVVKPHLEIQWIEFKKC